MKAAFGGIFIVAGIGVFFLVRGCGPPLDYEVIKSHVDETLPGNAVWSQEVLKDGKRFLLIRDTFVPVVPNSGFSIRQHVIPGTPFPVQDESAYPVVFMRVDDDITGVWRLSDGKQIWP